MAIKQKRVKPARVEIITTLPAVGKAEMGEIYYDSTNAKLALKTTEGWVYFSKD